MEVVSSHLIHLVFLAFLLIPIGCLAHKSRTHKHVALFILGDSLFDPGNNNYINTTTEFQANFYPYGESFFNPPTGRFSDGRLISDFIAEFAKLPIIPAYLKPGYHEFVYGANFASGGAGALVETHAGFAVDLITQLSYFNDLEKQLKQKVGDNEAKQLLSDAVYLINCGGNDYLAPSTTNSNYTQRQYVEMVMDNLTVVIKGIYEKGGRKFGFVSMPPLACWPSVRAQEPANGCREELDALSNMHNQALSINLNKLEMQLKGFMYTTFDFYSSVRERMMNPSKYGFKEGGKACCGSGPYGGVYSCGGMRGIKKYHLCDNSSEYLFFDSFHPSEMAYKQLAELFWQGESKLTGHYSLKSLFEGNPSPTFLPKVEL